MHSVIKMRSDVSFQVAVPEGVEVTLGRDIVAKSRGKELVKRYLIGKLNLRQDGGMIFVEAKQGTKREKKLAGTIAGKIRNMIIGVKEGYTYKLQVAGSHFPMKVEIDNAAKQVTVKNFLGERVPRKTKILEGVDVKIQGEIITVQSIDKDAAGQTAANIETMMKVRGKDRRIFQDGIYLLEKPE